MQYVVSQLPSTNWISNQRPYVDINVFVKPTKAGCDTWFYYHLLPRKYRSSEFVERADSCAQGLHGSLKFLSARMSTGTIKFICKEKIGSVPLQDFLFLFFLFFFFFFLFFSFFSVSYVWERPWWPIQCLNKERKKKAKG